ncbi:MAG TPA: TolC family protein [Terriglobales bacterium]|nr:TolC family protein [Terriglobales bacterium]
MKLNVRLAVFCVSFSLAGLSVSSLAEPLPLKHAVELALSHGAAATDSDEQRAFASYHEARNQYVPQFVVGSGLGKSWGFPLSLEGSAPSILNVNSQSAIFNPALREFVRGAKSDWQASMYQTKDQREQLIQDTVLTYAELNHWEQTLSHLEQEQADAAKMESVVIQRVEAGVDSAAMKNQARLVAARTRLRAAEAHGSIDILRNRLSQLTGFPADKIETVTDSIPSLPEVKQEDDLAAKAMQASPIVLQAENHALAESFRAKGEHRSLLPSIDFAAQYALLAEYNNYDVFYNSFQRHNATVGVSIRFPFFNASQHSRAQAADATAQHAKADAKTAKDRVSDQTLKLQRSVEQLSAAQEVASLEYQISQSNVEALQVRVDAGTANVHDMDDARTQANERYHAFQSADFELQRAKIGLLRATGELESWVGVPK